MDRILLVYPDVAVRDELTFILQHSGFQVINASKGEQAIAEIRSSSPDLVVMAETVHRMNGDELCVRIRALSQAPIIVLAQEGGAAGIEMLEMGADAYLAFPLDWRELVARVRSLLRRHKENTTTSWSAKGWKEGA
jgi:DNA-binding response OmpR family regulator